MRKIGAFIGLLFVTAIGFAQVPPQFGSVGGIVLDGLTRRPVADVRVSIRREEARLPSAETSTDGEGRFALRDVAPGRYLLNTRKDGYLDTRPPGQGLIVTIGDRQNVSGLSLALRRPSAVSGRVLTAAGQPVVGARLRAQGDGYGSDGQRQLLALGGLALVSTDDRGEFRMYDMPAGSFIFSVYGLDPKTFLTTVYFPGTIDPDRAVRVEVEGGQEKRLGDIVIPSIVRPFVRVKVNNLSGSTVEVSAYVYRRLATGRDLVASLDLEIPGPVDVSRLPAGSYELDPIVLSPSPMPPVYLPPVAFDVAASEVLLDVTIPPHPRVRLTGRVVANNGSDVKTPVSDVYVRFHSQVEAYSGSDGTFSIANVPVGKYRPTVLQPPSNLCLESIAGVVTGQELEITRDLDAQVTLRNVNYVRGKASASDATVVLLHNDRSKPWLDKTAGSHQNGDFEFRCVDPGDYHIYAWKELHGAAYRNAEFMKAFQDKGRFVHVDGNLQLEERIIVLENQ